MKNRRTELDLCRIAACFLVVLTHIGSGIYHACPFEDPAFPALCFLSTLVRSSVPTFFLLSGLLFLQRDSLELRSFLQKHVLRLTLIFFVWSFLYAVGSRLASGEFGGLYDFFLTVMRGHYHMWFLPAMIVCYLFLPVLFAALHGTRIDARYLVLLFAIFGLLWANLNLTPEPTYILHQLTVDFDISCLPYLGYMLVGYLLGQRDWPKKTLWIAPLVYFAVTLVASGCNHWYSLHRGYADGWLFSYFSIPSFLQSVCLFCFFLALKEHEFKHSRLIAALADCTLGVYLVHPLLVKVLERLGLTVRMEHPVAGLLGLGAAVMLLSLALIYAVKKIPFVKRFM